MLLGTLLFTFFRIGILKFSKGLRRMIPAPWLSSWNAHEIQFLISGQQGPLDLQELMRYTHYSNGYHETHHVILIFWQVLDN